MLLRRDIARKSSAGALIGALFIAPVALRWRRVGLLVNLAAGFIGGWYIVFSRATSLPLALIALCFTGGGAGYFLVFRRDLRQWVVSTPEPGVRARDGHRRSVGNRETLPR